MIHIILTILKAAGILLAAVVLFLLLVLLLVLFVPLRYRLDGKKYGMFSEAEADVRIRWLLGAAELRFGYQKSRVKAGFRILWIKKQLAGEKKVRADTRKKPLEESLEESEIRKDSVKGQAGDKALLQKEKVREDEKKSIPAEKSVSGEKKSSAPETVPAEESAQTEKEKKFHLPDICGMIKRIISSVKDIVKKASDARRSLEEKWNTVQSYLSFLRSEMTKEILGILKNHVFYLIKHIRPRKIKGTLHFGMEDPSLTGQLTGVLYLILPAYCYKVVLQPDFEKKILEGELHIAGHIRLIHLLKVGLQIFFNKKLRAYWKRINQLRRKQ